MKLVKAAPGKGPRICGVITKALSQAMVNRALKNGADLIELRLDTFNERDPEQLRRAAKKIKSAGAPLIITIRSVKEGGREKISDSDRLLLFKALSPVADFIDIELSSKRIIDEVVRTAKRERCKVIVSFHNFSSTPSATRLAEIVKAARLAGGDIVKVAAMVKTNGDLRRLTSLLIEKGAKGDLVVIGMGDKARGTRLFFPLLGSPITYGSIGDSTAPGQISLKELRQGFKRYNILGK